MLMPPPATGIYTLSLHDALPISHDARRDGARDERHRGLEQETRADCGPASGEETAAVEELRERRGQRDDARSEEHTSELQSRQYLVCRLLLEKKKKLLTIETQFK